MNRLWKCAIACGGAAAAILVYSLAARQRRSIRELGQQDHDRSAGLAGGDENPIPVTTGTAIPGVVEATPGMPDAMVIEEERLEPEPALT